MKIDFSSIEWWSAATFKDACLLYVLKQLFPLQDIIERAIINVQVGHDVMEPGSYIWELPYPCYMQDQ